MSNFTDLGPPSQVLEDLTIYVPSIGNTSLQKLPCSTVITNLAAFYETHGLKVSRSSLAVFFGTTPEQVSLLQETLGGANMMKELVLWAANRLREVGRTNEVMTSIMGLVVVLILLSSLTTSLRLWSHYALKGREGLGWSDWTLVAGVVCAIGIASQFGGNVVNLTSQGTGTIYFINYHAYILTQIHSTIEQIMYHAAVGLVKTSVLIFYYTLPSQPQYMRGAVLLILSLNLATNISGLFFNIFSCSPVDYWNHALTAVCVDYTLPIFILGISNIFCDIMIWLMPLAMVWKVTQSVRARALAATTITAAAGACIASAFRCHLLWAQQWEVSNGNMADFSISICTAVEVNVMVVCYNIPAIRSLIINYLERRKKARESQPDTPEMATILSA